MWVARGGTEWSPGRPRPAEASAKLELQPSSPRQTSFGRAKLISFQATQPATRSDVTNWTAKYRPAR
jgi:hypothetical protein